MITSAANPRVKLVRKLESRRQREKLGLFVCEGEDLVEAGLDAGLEPVEALVDAERPALVERLSGSELVAPEVMAGLSTLAHPPRVIAMFRRADLPRGAESAGRARPLARGGSREPRDAVARRRRARAGIRGALAQVRGPHRAKALRASAGAVFRVPLASFEDAPAGRVALVPRGGAPLAEIELPDPVTFVLGAEREGVPDEVLATCEATATIPQAEASESLNVAVAGAIALYEWRRRR